MMEDNAKNKIDTYASTHNDFDESVLPGPLFRTHYTINNEEES
jgi:hypothetical protein